MPSEKSSERPSNKTTYNCKFNRCKATPEEWMFIRWHDGGVGLVAPYCKQHIAEIRSVGGYSVVCDDLPRLDDHTTLGISPKTKEWESVGENLDRFRIPGGWLYRTTPWSGSAAMVFIPDRTGK